MLLVYCLSSQAGFSPRTQTPKNVYLKDSKDVICWGGGFKKIHIKMQICKLYSVSSFLSRLTQTLEIELFEMQFERDLSMHP